MIDANPSPFDTESEVHCTSNAALILDGFNFVDGMFPTCEYVDPLGDNDLVGFANSLDADLDFYSSTPIGHHAPNRGSPLIDHGPPNCDSPDQIGTARPLGASCDTGSIEVP